MGIATFKTALIADITANFTAGQRTIILNEFVSEYQAEWNARVSAGTPDTPTNRGIFVADKTVDYFQGVILSGQRRTSITALPPPIPLP